MISEKIPSTVALPLDQHLEEDMIFTLPTTPLPTPGFLVTQPLDKPTARQLAINMEVISPTNSWRVVINFNLTKLKSSMKLHEEIADFGDLA